MKALRKYTLKSLKENKSRTLMTVVGIILSVAMLTAVTTLVACARRFLVDSAIASGGNWHRAVYNIDIDNLDTVEANLSIKDAFFIQNLGYSPAPLKEDGTAYGREVFIYIGGASRGYFENMPVEIIAGRLPESSGEIILPTHLLKVGGYKNINIGDEITLDTGERLTADGTKLWQEDYYGNYDEFFRPGQEKTYTVVGFYERSWAMEHGWTFTVLTCPEEDFYGSGGIYVQAADIRKARDIYNWFFKLPRPAGARLGRMMNYELLRFSGTSGESGFNMVLYGLAAILIFIIMTSSIVLIYNAFSISVSERTKYLAVLASIGATPAGIRGRVMFEVMVLLAVGLPLGVASGIVGIKITLDIINRFFGTGIRALAGSGRRRVTLRMTVNPMAILAACLLGGVTVFIAARVPALKAGRISVMQAIRQTEDIKVNRSKIPTNPVVTKIFGFEGRVASKNLKRNRSKYISTVVGLFISITLFIFAHSFTNQLSDAVGRVITEIDYDLQVGYIGTDPDREEEIFRSLSEIDGISRRRTRTSYFSGGLINMEDMWPGAVAVAWHQGEEDRMYLPVTAVFVDDETYEKWLAGMGYEISPDEDRIIAFTTNRMKKYNSQGGYFTDYEIFKNVGAGFSFVSDKDGKQVYIPMVIGGIADEMPYGTREYRGDMPLVLPMSKAGDILGTDHLYKNMVFSRENPRKAADEMEILLRGEDVWVNNRWEEAEIMRSLIAVVNIFCYGFIALICLICMTNIFNTVNTNINLRRREFAIMKSVGMTEAGVGKTVALECMFYAFKGLFWGLPRGIILSMAVFLIIRFGYVSGVYHLPYKAMAISALGAVGMVAIAAFYAVRKAARENITQAIRNENL